MAAWRSRICPMINVSPCAMFTGNIVLCSLEGRGPVRTRRRRGDVRAARCPGPAADGRAAGEAPGAPCAPARPSAAERLPAVGRPDTPGPIYRAEDTLSAPFHCRLLFLPPDIRRHTTIL